MQINWTMSQHNHPTDGLLLGTSDHVRRPEVSIRTLNPPPQLPSKQQKYFYTTPDATINVQSDSGINQGPLGHLQAAEGTSEFAYAEANRLGTQSAYLNVPHMVQRTLVPLVLPSAKEASFGNEPFVLPFPHLSKGDVAFYLRLENDWNLVDVRSSLLLVSSSRGQVPPLSLVCRDWEEAVRKRKRQKMQPDEIGKSLMMSEGAGVFVNLQTVNYILHGIQHYGDAEPNWRDTFWRGFGLHRLDPVVQSDAEQLCTHVVRHCMGPFGVVASETNQRSDQAVAMVVDGRLERMRNYWAFLRGDDGSSSMHDDLVDALNERVGAARKTKKVAGTSAPGSDELAMPQAGDELILVLEKVEMRLAESFSGADDDDDAFVKEYDKWSYVLPNRNDPAGVRMVFPLKRSARRGNQPVERKHYIWQLVPSILSAGNASCWERRGFWSLGTVT